MSTEIGDIAAALVTELNAQTWSQTFTAARFYRPLTQLKNLGTLAVTVVPRGLLATEGSRSEEEYAYELAIVVQKRLEAVTNALIDPLVDLVEQIADHFRLSRCPGYAAAICRAMATDPLADEDDLNEFNQFTSILTLTYRVMR